MKVAVDTSFLVAAIVASHRNHDQCKEWMVRINAGEVEAVASAHMPLEAYNSLTRNQVRIKPSVVQEILLTMTRHIDLQGMSNADWPKFFNECRARNVLGGAVFDFQHVFIAESCDVDRLLTLDQDDFRRLWRGRDDIVIGVG